MRRAFAAVFAVASVVSVAALAGSSRADTTPPAGRGGSLGVLENQNRGWASASPRAELVDDGMGTLPTFAHEGRRFVLGSIGDRYRIRVTNPTAQRVEAVVSVDGLDAIDGRTASVAKRGYIVPAFGTITIDGWRTSLDTVAAFRFSSVHDSFASRTGRDRNVGVVGVAFFRESQPVQWRPPRVARGAAPSPAAGAGGTTSQAPSAAPGLGTQFGESHDSRVEETSFVRADTLPANVSELRYDDRAGLLARGIELPPVRGWTADIERRDTATPFPETRFAQPPR
jgi:hypothetical protein